MISLKDFKEFSISESVKIKGGTRYVYLNSTYKVVGGSHDGDTGTDTRTVMYEGDIRMKEFVVFEDGSRYTYYDAY